MKNIFICFTSIIIVILFCAYPWFLTMILKKTLLAWFIAIGGVFVTALLYILSKRRVLTNVAEWSNFGAEIFRERPLLGEKLKLCKVVTYCTVSFVFRGSGLGSPSA